jgi:hypothetical protein
MSILHLNEFLFPFATQRHGTGFALDTSFVVC